VGEPTVTGRDSERSTLIDIDRMVVLVAVQVDRVDRSIESPQGEVDRRTDQRDHGLRDELGSLNAEGPGDDQTADADVEGDCVGRDVAVGNHIVSGEYNLI